MILTQDHRLVSLQAENEDLRLRLSRAESELGAARRESREHDRDRKPIRRAMRGSEDVYRMIVESAVDYAIIATDLDGTITTWNEAAEEILGWSELQIVGRPIETIFTPGDVQNGIHLKEMRLSLTDGQARDQRWHMKANGSRFFASSEMMPLYDDDDEAVGYIKILRDRTREILAEKELKTSRERLQLALDASAIVGTFDWDVESDIIWADIRFASVFGLPPETAEIGASLEAFVEGIHPDDRERVTEKIRSACETGEPFIEEYRTIDADGRLRWIFCRGRCFLDENKKPVRFPGAIVDITAEKERTLRQAGLLRLGDDLLKEMEPNEYAMNALRILGETLDVSRVGYASVSRDGRTATIVNEWTADDVEALRGDFDLEKFGEEFRFALGGGLVTINDMATDTRTAAHAERFAEISVRSLVNITVIERGELKMIFYVHDDRPRPWSSDDIAFIREILSRAWTYTRRRRAELALVETETRLRLAHEAAEIGTFDYDIVNGKLIWDARCRAMFGIFGGENVTYDDTFVNGVHPEDRERVTAAVDATLDPNKAADYDIVYRTVGLEDGVVRHVQAKGQTLIENGKTVRFVGAVRDITEEKLAEERQSLLTRELQHRVKNTLAMVTAIANQTIRRATNTEDGLEAFTGRIAALSKAHDILVETSWTSAPIAEVVERTLVIHHPGRAERLVWSGPQIMLTARQALALSLALHELATNATKYGALSNEDGKVEIRWTLKSRRPDGQGMSFEWRESGGPPVKEPERRGFGSRLIKQSLAAEFGGELELHYRPDGLVCAMDATLGD
ncbi:sensor histidine kinase, putative [Fulvimarina pelagi HTCC2506]|uniref:Blue-light-activated histidine kinase n=1 Tax=Fulvimarina pelagi HTCC2506 TaxID=314231 RepID=Q0G4X2_9HYPH|nr:PAS domain S-box protein [Fulvimarina pelagi]EAU43292.1 sensor histidine kinase, putative [Fulvimarina pelagi HTCC2506]